VVRGAAKAASMATGCAPVSDRGVFGQQSIASLPHCTEEVHSPSVLSYDFLSHQCALNSMVYEFEPI
jgi:hypothetical protein